jgi:hypothetical protein
MNPTREAAYLALFAKVQTVPGLKTCTRDLQHWSDCPSESQPALYLQVAGESRSNAGRYLPPRIELQAKLWVYVDTGEGAAGPVINPILDAIDAAITTPLGCDTQTLGDVVQHCWIDGQTEIFEGGLGSQAVAIVPVNLLITPYGN